MLNKRAIIIYLFLTGIGILLITRYSTLTSTLFIIVLGSIIALYLTYQKFKSRPVFLFQLFARIFTAITIITGIFLARPYPEFTIMALPITLLLAIIFGGLAAYTMHKERTNNK